MKPYDNTKLSPFRSCMRRGYWTHVRHLQPEGTAAPLAIGGIVHSAIEAGLHVIVDRQGADLGAVQGESLAVLDVEWQKRSLPRTLEEMEEKLKPKHFLPAVSNAVALYWRKWWDWLHSVHILAIEKPFAIPLFASSSAYVYTGRMDAVIEEEGRLTLLEHKTTSAFKAPDSFLDDWKESFQLDAQVEGYIAGMAFHYPGRKAFALVDGILLHRRIGDSSTDKKARYNGELANGAFIHVPLAPGEGKLDAWLENTRSQVARVSTAEEAYEQQKTAGLKPSLHDIAALFPQNPDHCFGKYGKCPYFELCLAEPNPEDIEEVPPGFIRREWDPVKGPKGALGPGEDA